MPDSAQLPLHVFKLIIDGLEPLALLTRHAIHLLVHDLHQRPDVAVGQDVGADLADDHLLEPSRVDPRRIAGVLAILHDGLAHVVGEPAALGDVPAERPVARLALDQSAEQVGAPNAAGVGHCGRTGAHQPIHAAELGLGDDAGERMLHTHGASLVLSIRAPDQCPHIRLILEHVVDRRLRPELACGAGDPLAVEGPDDLNHPGPGLRHVEYPLDHAGRALDSFQGGALLRSVLHVHLPVAVGRHRGHPEAARGGLAHPPHDLLRKVLRVELVHALDNRLHQLSCRRVVGVLGDGDDPDALLAQHRLEGNRVLALAREAGELPDQYLPEGRVGLGGLVDHLAEFRPVGDAPALGLVHVLAGDEVPVLLGVVPQCPQLSGHGQVHVLPVAGDPGVQGRRRVVGMQIHQCVLLSNR